MRRVRRVAARLMSQLAESSRCSSATLAASLSFDVRMPLDVPAARSPR